MLTEPTEPICTRTDSLSPVHCSDNTISHGHSHHNNFLLNIFHPLAFPGQLCVARSALFILSSCISANLCLVNGVDSVIYISFTTYQIYEARFCNFAWR